MARHALVAVVALQLAACLALAADAQTCLSVTQIELVLAKMHSANMFISQTPSKCSFTVTVAESAQSCDSVCANIHGAACIASYNQQTDICETGVKGCVRVVANQCCQCSGGTFNLSFAPDLPKQLSP